jgi:hypothetical protein
LVRDTQGVHYKAVALEVDSGPRLRPRFPDDVVEHYPNAPFRPVLVQTRDQPLVVLHPDKLKLRIGTAVEVRGTLILGSAYAVDSKGSFHGTIPPPGSEHIIMLRYEPRAIER